MNHIDKREIRGRVLKVLDLSRPYPVSERTIWLSLNDQKLHITIGEIPKEMAYLRDKEYIESEEVHDKNLGTDWMHKLTAKGVDLIEGRKPIYPDPGISIPGLEW